MINGRADPLCGGVGPHDGMVCGDGTGCATLLMVRLRGSCHVADDRYLARNRNSGQRDREQNHGKRYQEVANAVLAGYSRRTSGSPAGELRGRC